MAMGIKKARHGDLMVAINHFIRTLREIRWHGANGSDHIIFDGDVRAGQNRPRGIERDGVNVFDEEFHSGLVNRKTRRQVDAIYRVYLYALPSACYFSQLVTRRTTTAGPNDGIATLR